MYIDLFICAVMLWAIYNGWRNGFLKEVFSTLGILAGLALAAVVYFYLANDYFKVSGSETNQFLNIGAFLIIWIVIPLCTGLVANLLTVALKGMQLGYPNSILGMLFSVAKFTILISCVLNVMGYLNILDHKMTRESHLYEPAVKVLPFVRGEAQELYEETDFTQMADTVWFNVTKK